MSKKQSIVPTSKTVEADKKLLEVITEAYITLDAVEGFEPFDPELKEQMVKVCRIAHTELINRKSLQKINARRREEIDFYTEAWNCHTKEDLIIRLQEVAENHRKFYHESCVIEELIKDKAKDNVYLQEIAHRMSDLTDSMNTEKKVEKNASS